MKTAITAAILALAISAIGITFAARDGSGTYSLPAGNPVSTGTTISSTWANNTLADIATALTNSIAKDGQTVPTANLPMGGFRHTNVADANARNQYATASQVQDFSTQNLSSVSGTNTIIGSLNPPITGYSAGMMVVFTPSANNTGATTLAVNGLTALDVLKADGDALISGDLVAGIPAVLVLDSGADDWILLNPHASLNGIATSDFARLSQANTFTAEQTIPSQLNFTTGISGFHEFVNRNASARGYKFYTGGGGSSVAATLDTSGIFNAVGGLQVNGTSVRDTAILTSGTLADARVALSNVTQHLTGGISIQANGRNVTNRGGTLKTLSTSAPSGGSDGDIWFRY